jgi:uncharacterized SAM-binding protein YcdF (DUF218 family)
MLFTLKKVIGGMMLPLPLLLIIMGSAWRCCGLAAFRKQGKCASAWLAALLLLSLQPVADSLLKPIEDSYPTWQGNQKVEYIVVLGGGYTWNLDWAPSSNLINNSLPRLNEGIRLWRESGIENDLYRRGGKTNPVSTAEAGAEWRSHWAYRAAISSRWINLKIPKKKPQR